MARICLLLAVSAILIIASKSVYSTKSASEKPPLTKKILSNGEKLYGQLCSSCHGPQGDGSGAASYLLFPKPRDFTQGEFRLISTSNQSPSNQDLFNSITRGMPGSSMPPWEYLPENDRWSLVYYVRYLSELGMKEKYGELSKEQIQKGLAWETQKELADPELDPHSQILVPSEPPSTKESVMRGQKLFGEACALCHGPQGKGDGKQVMVDSSGYPIKPRDLTSGIFKGSGNSQDLWFRIMAGLPGSPMPGYQGAYKDEQIWDLIHYIQTLSPEGAEEKGRLRRNLIKVRRVNRNLNLDPTSKEWSNIEPIHMALTPLWWRDERVAMVDVRAVHDGSQIAIHLQWDEKGKNDSVLTPQSFSDGAAIQLTTEKNPPLFSMGDKNTPVTIWHWKASWQKEKEGWSDIETQYPNAATDFYESQASYKHGSAFEISQSNTKEHDRQYVTAWGAGNPLSDPHRKSAAEEAKAKGFGTLTTQKENDNPVEANGIWKDGKWNVVFSRALIAKGRDRLQLKAGQSANIAFAIWEGKAGDRNGQKEVSTWNELILE